MLPAGQSEALFFLSSFPFRSKGKLERRCEEPCIGAAVLVQMITGADNYINEVTGKNNLVMSLETQPYSRISGHSFSGNSSRIDRTR